MKSMMSKDESNTNQLKNKYLKSPWLEVVLMFTVLSVTTVALGVISIQPETVIDGHMPTQTIVLYLIGFFLISFVIAMLSVVAGIGGGVLFTPIMLAFTPVDSLIIRATGLIVAMFSGLISTGIFMKKGLGNFKLSTLLTTSQGVGAFLGAQGAIFVYQYFGNQGEASIRIVLGMILALISAYFFIGGKKLEWPTVKKVDKFTERLNLSLPYFEETEDRVIDYKLTRAGYGLMLTFLVGIIGGFFGMGGGWAITPVLNLVMGMPLKVAAANSGVILGMVTSVAVWPYILIGAIIPLFVVPWLSGQVLGGYLGSLLLVKMKVDLVRQILIGIMGFTSFGLVAKGLELLKIINPVNPEITLLIFTLILILISFNVVKTRNGDKFREARSK